jgi:hypothetical protein
MPTPLLEAHARIQPGAFRDRRAPRRPQQEEIGHAVNDEDEGHPRPLGRAGAPEWEHKLQENEVQFLRSVADLQGGFQHRVTLMEASHRDLMRWAQHRFPRRAWSVTELRYSESGCGRIWRRCTPRSSALSHLGTAIDPAALANRRPLQRRSRPIHPERRRDKPDAVPFDYGRFAERFRGPEEHVKAGQQFTCRTSKAAATCSISAAGAASSSK